MEAQSEHNQPTMISTDDQSNAQSTRTTFTTRPTTPNKELVFQSQINSIEPFTGAPGQDATRWLTHTSNILQVQGFTTNSELNQLISGFLDGEALDWFQEQKKTNHDWFEFRAAFTQRFPSPPSIRNPFEHFQQLSNRRQGINETTVEYYSNVLKLCHQYNPRMSDVERVDHLKKGLRASLLEKVLDRNPITPEEFIDVVFKAESNQRILQVQLDMNGNTTNNMHRNQQGIDDVRFAPPAVTSRSRYEAPPNQQSRPSDRPQRRPNGPNADIVCYTCGEPGHISPRCPLNWN